MFIINLNFEIEVVNDCRQIRTVPMEENEECSHTYQVMTVHVASTLSEFTWLEIYQKLS